MNRRPQGDGDECAEDGYHMSSGGIDNTTGDYVDWPRLELDIGDHLEFEILDTSDASPPASRRPQGGDVAEYSKKDYIRSTAKEFGWEVIEHETPSKIPQIEVGDDPSSRGTQASEVASNMNTPDELEKLVSLRDQGNFSEAGFEKAKARLVSEEQVGAEAVKASSGAGRAHKAVPGLWLAVGVFVGNLLGISITSGDVVKGLVGGGIAAALVVVFYLGVRVVKQFRC